MLNAAGAAFYYLRVVVYMYMRDPAGDTPAAKPGKLFRIGLAITLAGTLLMGLFPVFLTAATNAANALHG